MDEESVVVTLGIAPTSLDFLVAASLVIYTLALLTAVNDAS
jgi:hypothetical protein